uniref:EF-hand domain-containing protein n=1 Tax=Chaetoceros debilis TaxID=122233 RepID=A0A7S3Q3M6_9STRA
MKFSCIVTAAVLTTPSLLGNAFVLDGNSRRASLQQQHNVESVTAITPLAASTQAEDVEVCSSSWFDNNDSMADSIFDTIDTDEDDSVSNAELQEYLENIIGSIYNPKSIRLLFATLDQNADGCISREEMRFAFSNYDILALYDAFGITKGLKAVTSDKIYIQAIEQLRSDADIDPSASPAMLNILADLMFDKIDTDASGEIDLNELKEHYNRENNNDNDDGNDDDNDESATSILSALDVNSDGKISREEMRAGFNQFNPKSLSKALGVGEVVAEEKK